MSLGHRPATQHERLTDLAEDCMQVSSHASTLAEVDRWEGMAEQLRLVAHLVERTYDDYHTVASAFISAAGKMLAAEEEAVHESRASRRPTAVCDVLGHDCALGPAHRHETITKL